MPCRKRIKNILGLCPGSGSALERLEPLRLRRSLRLRTSKKFAARHRPASPPDVRHGYALVRAQPLRDLNRCGFAVRSIAYLQEVLGAPQPGFAARCEAGLCPAGSE